MEIICPNSPWGVEGQHVCVCMRVYLSEDSPGSGGSLFRELALILLTVSLPSLPHSHSISSTLGGIPCDISIIIIKPNLK